MRAGMKPKERQQHITAISDELIGKIRSGEMTRHEAIDSLTERKLNGRAMRSEMIRDITDNIRMAVGINYHQK